MYNVYVLYLILIKLPIHVTRLEIMIYWFEISMAKIKLPYLQQNINSKVAIRKFNRQLVISKNCYLSYFLHANNYSFLLAPLVYYLCRIDYRHHLSTWVDNLISTNYICIFQIKVSTIFLALANRNHYKKKYLLLLGTKVNHISKLIQLIIVDKQLLKKI